MGTHPIKIELTLGWHLLSSDYKHKFCSCLLLLFFFTRSNVWLFSQAQIASPETKLVECQQDGCCQGDVSDWAHLFVSMCSRSLPVLEMTCALARSQCRMHVNLWGSRKQFEIMSHLTTLVMQYNECVLETYLCLSASTLAAAMRIIDVLEILVVWY